MKLDPFPSLQFFSDHILLLDQRLLPFQEKYIHLTQLTELIDAIKNLAIRGAPLLGFAGLCGLYLASLRCKNRADMDSMVLKLSTARPTAIQLSSCVDSSYAKHRHLSLEEQSLVYFTEAKEYELQMFEDSENIAKNGQELVADTCSILTHCNTGSLAMHGWGTALGVILYGSSVLGKDLQVYYTETRPLQQGLRLTSFELHRHHIKATCITDSSAAYLMQERKIDLVITGADRIALNGDTANKIGTYMLALSAYYHQIPFYIAAPTSTIDFSATSGKDFEIELREAYEFFQCASGKQNPPEYFKALNPAFDVCPGDLISAFITEKGLLQAPF
ncbi:MAG TPA: S-methyl-5-thioribose-1-phosphate isomerase [Caldisericia bacterium]|nr:S-methyl-5-thioribose-1-phosphate isomerase [Caldisericia bacterium]